MSSRRALVWAVAIAWLLEHVVPFGRLVLYPFTLLATWVHETGHGVAAMATGGRFERLLIFADASGLAETRTASPAANAITCLGGMLAPPLVGALLLAVARGPRRARIALATIAGLLVVTLALWVRSPAGLVVVPACAALLGWAAWSWAPERRLVLAQFIAITLALDTVGRMVGYALASKATVGGSERTSDVAAVADALGGNHLLWGALVITVALALLAAGLWAAWRPSQSGPSPGRARASRR
ncbi:MAG TPA: M50 family metallopeptidase [Polyangia bacterium]